MPALTYLILGKGSAITKIDGSKPVSDDSPGIRGRWADLQLYSTRNNQ